MSVFSSHSHSSLHLPQARRWPAIGASLAAMLFLLAWAQAAVQLARGAARVQLSAPLEMSFGHGGLYLALGLGLLASAFVGALAGGVVAAVAILPAERR